MNSNIAQPYLPYLATWLNATATITHVVKLDAAMATIQGRLLFKGGVYYIEASSVWLLFNYYELKNR